MANTCGICQLVVIELNRVQASTWKVTDVEKDPLCLSKPIPICLTVSGCTQAQGVHTRPLFFLHN